MKKLILLCLSFCIAFGLSAQEAITQEDSVTTKTIELGEISVKASAVVRKKDRLYLFPSAEQIEKSADGLELTRRLALPRIMVDPNNRSISMANGNVQLRVNGLQATSQEVAAIPSADIKRIEYHSNPGLRYGEGVDVVLDYITIRHSSGGNLGVDLNHQLNTFWLADFLSGKYNQGRSEFSLSSFANGHRYTEFWKDITETFHYPEGDLVRKQKGIPSRNYEFYWATTANYSYSIGEESFLNARFNMLRYDYPHDYGKSWLGDNQKDELSYLTDNTKQLTSRPSLDLYFYHKFPNKQSLALNAVVTYSHTENEHLYKETLDDQTLTDIVTDVKGKRYSIIGEGVYEKELSSGRLTAGLKHTQAYTDNLYTGSGNYRTKMTEAESYLYTQYVGSWEKLVYNLGVGVSRNYLSQQDADSYDRWYFRPTVSLTLNATKSISIRYRYSYRNQNPSLAQLSDVEQWIDSLQIRKGNPKLRPYAYHFNALDLDVYTARVKTGMTLSHQYMPDCVMEESRFDASRQLFIRTYGNQKRFQRLSVDAYLEYSPWGDYLQISASGGMNHFISDGNWYAHHFTDGFYTVSLHSDVKRFTFGLMFYKRAFTFSGETSSEADNFNQLSVNYRIGKVQLGASCSIPFYSTTARYRTENRSAIAPYVSDIRFGDIYPSFRLTFSYHIDFGRKYQSGRRKVNNADNESGILNNRK